MLITAPWAPYSYPSIQLGLLKAYASSKGFDVSAEHWNLIIANELGNDSYSRLASRDLNEELIGESLFSRLLYPELLKSLKHKRILKEKLSISNISMNEFMEMLLKLERISASLLSSYDWSRCSSVGFTIQPSQLMASLYFAKEIKSRSKNTHIIFGGFRCRGSLGRWLSEKFHFIDYLVPSEGERAYVRILGDIKKSRQARKLKGVWKRSGANLVWGGAQRRIENLDSLPFPDYDDYFSQIRRCRDLETDPKLLLEAGRGCSWGLCRFCKEQGSRPVRVHSTRYFERMILHMTRKYETLKVYFCDSEFPAKTLYGKSSRRKLSQLGYFDMYLRSTINRDTLERLMSIGLRNVLAGFESFSDYALSQLNKGTRAVDNVQLMKWCKELGLPITSNLMFNYPQMRISDIIKTVRVLESLPYSGVVINWTDFFLEHGAEYQLNPVTYDLQNMSVHPFEQNLYPDSVTVNMVGHSYAFTGRNKKLSYEDLHDYNKLSNRSLFDHELFYIDNGETLMIYRVRPYMQTVLESAKRDLYIYLDCHRAWRDIEKAFPSNDKATLARWIRAWRRKGLVIMMDGRYMALAYKLRMSFV